MTVAVGCVVNVALNLLLIPRLAGMGAVIASCAAYWAAAHGTCWLYRPLNRTGGMITRALVPRSF
jgi:O-antigen/teichoic acid export membrane protein